MTYESLPPELAGIGPYEDFTDEQLLGEAELLDLPDAEHAEQAMRRLVRAHERVLEATVQRDAWLAPINEWYAQQTERDRRTAALLTQQLERFGVMVRERSDGRIKTVSLPSGEIATRHTQEAVEITDSKAVTVWAKGALSPERFAELCPPKEPLVSVLRDHVQVVHLDTGGTMVVDDQGEILDGVSVRQASTSATVKPRA